MANNEFTATKIVLKTEKDGVKKYCIPYVPNATSTETGLIKPDGTTTEVTDGVLSIKSGVIPAKVTEATVTGWGFTKNAGTVTKVNNVAPVNGNVTISIPAAVTNDTVAGWGFTKNAGTITGIKMNGASKGTSGVVDLGTVVTSTTDCVKISGDQTIAGIKTFSSTPVITSTALNIKNTNDVSIQKSGTNFIRKAAGGQLVLSASSAEVYIRPGGDAVSTSQVVIGKDATVTAPKFSGHLTGNVTGNCSGSSGSCTGNAATATKATSDGSGNNIVNTYSTKTELENALTTLTTQLTNAAK